MLFMVIVYRLPGLVADFALTFYIGILALILGLARVNLSLSGIAGIVLSIGMAVDGNVIIYERLKEELDKNIEIVKNSKSNKELCTSVYFFNYYEKDCILDYVE